MPKLPEPVASGIQDMVYEPERISPEPSFSAGPPLTDGPPIQFGCPSCAAVLQVKSELAGKVARCKCGTRIQVPVPVQQESLSGQHGSSYGLEPLEPDGFGADWWW